MFLVVIGAFLLVVIFAISAVNAGGTMTHTHGLIRTIYLYLFALVGLFAITFGFINGLGATLNRYVWPQEFVQYDYRTPAEAVKTGEKVLTIEQQKEQFVTQQNNEFRRRVTESIPGILIGWLLWWFHWGWIKRDQHKLIN